MPPTIQTVLLLFIYTYYHALKLYLHFKAYKTYKEI